MRIPVILGIAVLLSGCSERNAVHVSLSSNCRAWLSIRQGPEGFRIWVVNITAEADEAEFFEFMNDYPANLMAYIGWDDHERLWFYSSDDGSYFYWEKDDGQWKRCSWSIREPSAFTPPESLGEERNRN